VPNYPAAYVHAGGTNDDEIAVLVGWLDSPVNAIAVVAPGRQALDNSMVAKQLVARGAQAHTALRRGLGSVRGKAVLALWLDDTELSEVEISGPAKVALAPWVLEKCRLWRATRHPVELGGLEVPGPVELDPVVRTAIRSVAHLSNPANGLSSYNRDYAVNAFRILRKAGYTWDPVETAVVMAEGGWDLRAATEFEKLSKAMLDGKALRAGRSQFRSDILKQWRDRAEQDEPWP
jgi:hypothetical protein